MIHLDFSEADIRAIRHERFNHPDPRVQRSMEVLLLKANGLSHHQIQCISGVCGNTMRTYFSIYREGGIEKLKEFNDHRPQSQLVHYKQTSRQIGFILNLKCAHRSGQLESRGGGRSKHERTASASSDQPCGYTSRSASDRSVPPLHGAFRTRSSPVLPSGLARLASDSRLSW